MENIQQDEKTCPMCAEVIKRDALKCKHCHSEVALVQSPAAPEAKSSNGTQSTMANPKNVGRSPWKKYVSVVLLLQLLLGCWSYFVSPALMSAFFTNGTAQLILVGLALWQVLGLVFLSQIPYRQWAAVTVCAISALPLSLALVFGPLVSAWATQVQTNQRTAQSASQGQQPDEIFVNGHIKTGSVVYGVTRAVFKHESVGVTNVILYYNVSNEGNNPVPIEADDVLIVADGNKIYKPDDLQSLNLRLDLAMPLHSVDLQPGLSKSIAAVFEVPDSQLAKKPSVYVSRNLDAGGVPLFKEEKTSSTAPQQDGGIEAKGDEVNPVTNTPESLVTHLIQNSIKSEEKIFTLGIINTTHLAMSLNLLILPGAFSHILTRATA